MTPPFSLRAYLALSRVAAPLGRALLRRRMGRGKEDPARLPERMGVAAVPRPDGKLIWTHAASVGEALAALTLIEAMRAQRDDVFHLLTTGTLTSARVVAARAPQGVIHHFAPLDAHAFVTRFLEHWRPDVAARIDSEIWPATLWLSAEHGARLALVNARISARSAERWRRFAPGFIAALLGRVSLALAQDEASAERLRDLGASARAGGALKSAAEPPFADPEELAALRAQIGGRPVLLALSTHPGEEALALEASRLLRARHPDLLTLIVPRHPERGAGIAAGTGASMRSSGAGPGGEVYVADTLGEMGLWLRLAHFAYIGGSMAGQGLGGHTPYEAAALGVAVAHGPEVFNFADAYAALHGAQAAWRADDAAALAAAFAAADAAAGARAMRALKPDPGVAERAATAVLELLRDV